MPYFSHKVHQAYSASGIKCGNPMGSPLVVELAEIRVADVENTALTTYKDHPNTYKDHPNTYRHCVDDGIGDFLEKSHAGGFLNFFNSLTDDLQYTIEYLT